MEMNKNYRIQGDQNGDIYQEIYQLIETQPRKWQSVAAITGLMGAMLCPVLGTLLSAIGWLVVSQRAVSVLHILSVVFFALTIPLLACGAHCLDLIEKNKVHNSSSLDGRSTTFVPAMTALHVATRVRRVKHRTTNAEL
jgi:hypothetical protein